MKITTERSEAYQIILWVADNYPEVLTTIINNAREYPLLILDVKNFYDSRIIVTVAKDSCADMMTWLKKFGRVDCELVEVLTIKGVEKYDFDCEKYFDLVVRIEV